MSKPKVFISYSHQDEHWKDRLVSHLDIGQQEGLYELWDDRKIEAGEDWYAAIIRAIEAGQLAILLVSRHSLTSKFIRREEVPRLLAQRDLQQTRIFPVIVEPCDWPAAEWLAKLNLRPFNGRPVGETKDKTRTEFQQDLDLADIAKEIRQLLTFEPTALPAPEPLTGECPYLGLEAFTEDKEHLFFGRDDFADALFDKVKRQNFVALVGPSGCGKSSLVQAGLFPRLRRDAQKWETILLPPREDPFLSLAAGFVWRWQPQANYAFNTNEAKKLAAEMKDGQHLIEAVQRTVVAPEGRLLLVLDQFEEMFTLCDESARRAFLDVLLAVKDAAPMAILLTLRADFMGQAQSFSSAFSQLLDDGIVSHRPLIRADLETVITGPARYAGLEFEPGLVDLILQEVTAQPDSLPLLEYALKEMWRRRQSQTMGHALYEAVGKVEGAISQHADAVLQALPEAEQQLALRALTRLVRVADEEGEADTRLRLPLSELQEVERDVLQTFVTARLLVTKREEGIGTETIEVAHEALIRRWEKLREAIGRDREFLLWRRRLDFRRREWEENQRHESLLLQSVPLEEAKRWLNERGAELISAESEFITWEDRPEFQVERALTKSSNLLLLSDGITRESYFTTMVFCGEKEKALLIAGRIERDHDRAYALKLIAEALAKAGIVPDAMSVAREIKDANVRVYALGALIQTLARIGLTVEAQLAASEAQVAIQETESADDRVSALSQIIEALARVGMLTEMRQAVEEALASAIEIRSVHNRTTRIASIVAVLAKAGIVSEAIALANKIETEAAFARANALNSIAEAQAKEGMLAEAFCTAKEALVAARKIEPMVSRAWVLYSVAETLAKAGRTSEALAVVREIEEPDVHHIRPLAIIAEALAKAEPKADWQSILRMIEDAENTRHRGAGLAHWTVAQALAGVGRVTDLLAVAYEIWDASSRGNLLAQASEALMKAGKVIEALTVARHIEHPSIRAKPLGMIVEASMKIGVATETAFTATEALMVAREIEEAFVHANALMAVAVSWLAKGQIEEARNLVSEVQDAISKIFNDQERSKALGRLAIILARLRLYRAARETAEQCFGSSDRLAAYTAILREYHIERDPNSARLFAEEEEEEED